MTFRGIPPAAIEFYAALAADNSREFWAENKSTYESAVRAPVVALCAALADEFGEAELFRPYRDTRFSTNKAPYKAYQGAIVATEAGAGFYVEISATGLRTGGGYHAHDAAQLERYRAAVDDEDAGEELLGIISSLRRRGLTLAGDALKSKPRGFDADHPRIELLRQRDLVVDRLHGTPKWLHTAKAVSRVRADWDALRPLNEWLAEHVGPSELASPRWRR